MCSALCTDCVLHTQLLKVVHSCNCPTTSQLLASATFKRSLANDCYIVRGMAFKYSSNSLQSFLSVLCQDYLIRLEPHSVLEAVCKLLVNALLGQPLATIIKHVILHLDLSP